MTNKILDYTLALVNLYGIIECSKIAEIYNHHQKTKIKEEDLKKIFSEYSNFLRDHYIEMAEDHLISAEIRVLSNVKKELEEKAKNPFYVPEYKELLKYKTRNYFETNEAYKELESFLKTRGGCIKSSRKLARGIGLRCKSVLCYDKLQPYLKENNFELNNAHENTVFMNHVKNLETNTRKWSNNGYTLKELEAMEV